VSRPGVSSRTVGPLSHELQTEEWGGSPAVRSFFAFGALFHNLMYGGPTPWGKHVNKFVSVALSYADVKDLNAGDRCESLGKESNTLEIPPSYFTMSRMEAEPWCSDKVPALYNLVFSFTNVLYEV